MCSTRKSGRGSGFGGQFRRAALVAACGLAPVVAGCQRVPKNEPVALNDAPLVVDEAMQMREWDRSTSYYENTATVAGPHGRVLEVKESSPAYQQVLADAPVTVANFVMLPVTLVRTRPWTDVPYRGAITPPTFYAIPQMPPAPTARPAGEPGEGAVGEPLTAPYGAPGTPEEPTPVVPVPMSPDPATMQDAPVSEPQPLPADDPAMTPGNPPAAETPADVRPAPETPEPATEPGAADLNK